MTDEATTDEGTSHQAPRRRRVAARFALLEVYNGGSGIYTIGMELRDYRNRALQSRRSDSTQVGPKDVGRSRAFPAPCPDGAWVQAAGTVVAPNGAKGSLVFGRTFQCGDGGAPQF